MSSAVQSARAARRAAGGGWTDLPPADTVYHGADSQGQQSIGQLRQSSACTPSQRRLPQ